jgi:hypothetical protein
VVVIQCLSALDFGIFPSCLLSYLTDHYLIVSEVKTFLLLLASRYAV